MIERQTSRGVFGRTAYPFSSATRLEFGGGARALTFTRDARIRVYSIETGELIDRREEHTRIGQTLYLAEANVAIVRDTSFFGATGPIYGSRSRLEVGQSIGTLKYTTLLADWRRYFMPKRPVTIAVRALHFGRYGRDERAPAAARSLRRLSRDRARLRRTARSAAMTAGPTSRAASARCSTAASAAGMFVGEHRSARRRCAASSPASSSTAACRSTSARSSTRR